MEDQRSGMPILVILSVAVCYLSFLNIRQPISFEAMLWDIQEPDSTIVALQGTKEDGIYFLPPGAVFREWTQDAGIIPDGKKGTPIALRNGVLFSFSDGNWKQKNISSATKIGLGIPIDINSVSATDLLLVPGIGEEMAAKIILLRGEKGGFPTLEALKDVPGIKEKKLNRLKPYLYADSVGRKSVNELLN
jgi:competence protein ComEA